MYCPDIRGIVGYAGTVFVRAGINELKQENYNDDGATGFFAKNRI